MRLRYRPRLPRLRAGHATAALICAALAVGAVAVRAVRELPLAVIADESMAPAAAVTSPATAAAPGPTVAPPAAGRPFDHVVHERVLCTACHGAGEEHRTVRVRTARDCAACHHVTESARACSTCHAQAELPEPGSVAATMSFRELNVERVRDLPFGHRVHEPVACRDCHSTPVTLAMQRTCASCHEAHHGAERSCAACHEPTQQPVHDATVHLSCAGAACHAPERAPKVDLSRSLCLVCHATQRDHEPGGACASCHLLVTDRGAP